MWLQRKQCMFIWLDVLGQSIMAAGGCALVDNFFSSGQEKRT